MEWMGTVLRPVRWRMARHFHARRGWGWSRQTFCGVVMRMDFLRGLRTLLLPGLRGIICGICGFCWRSKGWEPRQADSGDCWAGLRKAPSLRDHKKHTPTAGTSESTATAEVLFLFG